MVEDGKLISEASELHIGIRSKYRDAIEMEIKRHLCICAPVSPRAISLFHYPSKTLEWRCIPAKKKLPLHHRTYS